MRFLGALPDFLKHPLSTEQAKRALAERFRDRGDLFLTLAKTAIYDHPVSPYLALLRLAGCEYGDLRQLVARNGIEETLEKLAREGVYLTADELKGRTPVSRGATTLTLDPTGLLNPSLRTHALARSSRGRRRRAPR